MVADCRLKVCFVGLGSIGQRHLRNLSSVCEERGLTLEVHALRSTSIALPAPLDTYVARQVRSLDELDGEYDAVFIANPTEDHFDAIRLVQRLSRNLFIEKPLFNTPAHKPEEIEGDRMPGGVYYVAAPLRHTELYAALEDICRSTPVFGSRIICSSYMPAWQPGRDYTKSFRTKSVGGGVDIDLIHEIDYMTGLFGYPKRVSRIAGQFSNLVMEACDAADYLFSYPDKTVQVHLDFFGRGEQRSIELYTEEDTIVGDFMSRTLKWLRSGRTVQFDTKRDHYRAEMEYFVDLLRSGRGENLNPIDNAYGALCLAKGVIPCARS